MFHMKLINRNAEGELQLIGRLDANAAADAEKVLVQTAARFDTLILNLAQLEYISSGGLRALRKARLAMKEKGGALAVKNVSPMVMEVFETSSFAALLKFI